MVLFYYSYLTGYTFGILKFKIITPAPLEILLNNIIISNGVNLKIPAEVVEWHTRRSQKPIRATL